MLVHQPRSLLHQPPAARPLRWVWVLGSTLIGAILLLAFLAVVDPALVRPRVSLTVFAATLIMTGIIAGYRSAGRTVWEPGIGGLILVALVSAALAIVAPSALPPGSVIGALVLGPLLAVGGAWAGEVLQGTYLDSSPRIQWLWIMVAIVVGFMAGVYCIYVAEALVGSDPIAITGAFVASFFVTGVVVGYFSPGRTIIEPGIAAAGIVTVDIVFCVLHFRAMFPWAVVLIAAIAGGVVAMAGAWLGEAAQRLRRAAPETPTGRPLPPGRDLPRQRGREG
jgi:hypothetical protein